MFLIIATFCKLVKPDPDLYPEKGRGQLVYKKPQSNIEVVVIWISMKTHWSSIIQRALYCYILYVEIM